MVVGMMLILMGGSIFGLHSFHVSNLTLTDQLRELGASARLVGVVVRLKSPRHGAPEERPCGTAERQVEDLQDALFDYHRELKKKNTDPQQPVPTTAA